MPVRPRLLAVAFALMSSASLAEATELFDACAASAASRFEPGYEEFGRADTEQFYAYEAIPACRSALDEDPGNVQVMAWLGHALVDDGKAEEGAALLEPAAAGGNMFAQRVLGDMLILGKGVGQDKPRGAGLLQQSADQGFVPAYLSLGYSYEFGDGVPVDAARAMDNYLLAAEGGLLRAQLLVADRYQRGIGVPVNEEEAFKWLSTAAASGDGDVLYKLGVAYLEGRGIARSYADAFVAFQASADNYSPEGSTGLGYMTELGLETEVDLDRASNLYSTGRYGNVAIAKHNYARLEEEGIAFEPSPVNARELYEEAARAGELRAAVNLALMMLEGRGGPQDIEGAFTWTKRAADGGNAVGLNNLGRMYEMGLGVTADLAEARRLYAEAAALGYGLAADNLSRIGG